MNTFFRLCTLLAVALFLSAASAKADGILNYQITGPGVNASFSLATNPNVTSDNLGKWFTLNPVPGTLNGSPVMFNMGFYNSSSIYDGGMTLYIGAADYAPAYGNTNDVQLYTGFENAPTMRTGIFNLFAANGTEYTLTVSTPEPSTLLLLGLGITGLALLALRRKQLA